MKIINIKWDTDGDKELLKILPTEIDITEEFDFEEYEIDGEFEKEQLWMIYLIGYQILTDIVILDLRLRDKGKDELI